MDRAGISLSDAPVERHRVVPRGNISRVDESIKLAKVDLFIYPHDGDTLAKRERLSMHNSLCLELFGQYLI